MHRDKVKVCYSANQEQWVTAGTSPKRGSADASVQCSEEDLRLPTPERQCDQQVIDHLRSNKQPEETQPWAATEVGKSNGEQSGTSQRSQVKKRSSIRLFNEGHGREEVEVRRPCERRRDQRSFQTIRSTAYIMERSKTKTGRQAGQQPAYKHISRARCFCGRAEV